MQPAAQLSFFNQDRALARTVVLKKGTSGASPPQAASATKWVCQEFLPSSPPSSGFPVQLSAFVRGRRGGASPYTRLAQQLGRKREKNRTRFFLTRFWASCSSSCFSVGLKRGLEQIGRGMWEAVKRVWNSQLKPHWASGDIKERTSTKTETEKRVSPTPSSHRFPSDPFDKVAHRWEPRLEDNYVGRVIWPRKNPAASL